MASFSNALARAAWTTFYEMERLEVEECEWFVNNGTMPAWCCNTHMFDGTGDYPATEDHPEDCDFKEES